MQPQSGSFFLYRQKKHQTDSGHGTLINKWFPIWSELNFSKRWKYCFSSLILSSIHQIWLNLLFLCSSSPPLSVILLHPPAISYATRRCLSGRRPSSRLRRYKLCFPSKCDFNKKCTRYNVTMNALTFLQWTPTHHLIKC